MKEKKLMLLGGLRYLLPVIEAAHGEGYHVITCDYLPDNIAHRYSDGFRNASVIDKEAVLALAKEENINGIMSFAVDPGVETASYVAEKLGLPFQGSYESVRILQNKDLFRKFLADHDFNTPQAIGFTTLSDAVSAKHSLPYPVIVKPVDSAGSKGVSRVDNPDEFDDAARLAFDQSHGGRIIVEEFLEKVGHSSDSECFTIDGKLVFCSFSDQRFDERADNPYTPAAYSWPSTMPDETQRELRDELQRLVSLLGLRTGIYNVETRLCTNGKPYIMEVSPRGGGNRLAEMLRYACGTDLIVNSVRNSMGSDCDDIHDPVYNGFLAEVILHADKSGRFVSLELPERIKSKVIEEDLWVKPNDPVTGFKGANNAIGTLVLRFETSEEMEQAMSDIPGWCKVVTTDSMTD